VEAKTVVLAAGCMATPVLLQRSGDLANASRQVGENLQFHPGTAAMGIFPEPTNPQFGATQGYQSLHFVGEGFKLETLWTPPGLLAVRVPGFGQELKQHFAEIPHSAEWDAIISANRSLGRVVARRSAPDPVLHWSFHPHDVQLVGRALFVLVEMFFAAGAKKVVHGVHGLPDEFHSMDDARALQRKQLRPTDFVCAANHAFSSTRMHGNPRHGVVDELGRCHDTDNLYVADSGVLPRSPSVNPMFTTMALAHRTAQALAAS
jgi:choline dehydrogenase-like flavoprotein